MCADFHYYLNRQGPQGIQGPKGDKGDKGDSITIYDGTVTPLIYTLIFDKGNGNTFETQNIRYPLEDRLGSYVRWDGTTQYLGTPDYADLTGTVGEVRLATTVNVGNNTVLNTDAVSYELFTANNSTISAQLALKADKATTYTKTEVDNLVTPKADKNYVDTQLATKANATDVYTKAQTDTLLAGKANTVHTHTLSQITNAGSFAAKNSLDYTSAELTNKPTLGSLAAKNTVDYITEVTNKPTIPIVGNGTITITQGGVTKGTFTTNQSGDSTIALDAGGGGVNFTAGTALELTNQNVLNVKIDNSTIITDSNGALKCNVTPGGTYTFTAPLVNTSGTISLDIDTDTMNITNGKLGANLEDITGALEAILGGDASIFSDYYTKAQCDGRFAPLSHTHTVSQITNFPTLATVATSGDYNDLTNKPTIPSTTNMVTTNTNQTITGVKTFAGNSTIFSSSTGNEIQIGNNTYYTVLGTWSNGKGYLYNTLENKIYVNGTTDWLLNKSMLDGTTITYDTTTDKISAISSSPDMSNYYTKTQVQNDINQGLKGYILTDSKGLAGVEQKYQSGVSTGIDTIKPDNYTINDTPTITNDGIASNFSNSSYLITNYDISNLLGKSWTICSSWINKNNDISNYVNCFFDLGTWISLGNVNFNTNTKSLKAQIRTGTASEPGIDGQVVGSTTLSNIPDYIIAWLSFDINTGVYKFEADYGEGKKTIGSFAATTTNKELYVLNTVSSSQYFRIGCGSGGNYNKNGADLNSFKIYVDGNLVYQACLKIPYTLSSTNEKIVDSDYRYRTLDQYKQYGSTPYYTLDSGVNYTLPLNELSGPISLYVQNQEDTPHIIDSYINTTTGDWYRVYSDKWCEQGGRITQTADQDFTARQVTFLKPFADSNYNASVTPTTCSSHAIMSAIESKSSSAITIGAYGFNSGNTITQIDWRAEGYIV